MYVDMETEANLKLGIVEDAKAELYFGLIIDKVLTAEAAAKQMKVSLAWF